MRSIVVIACTIVMFGCEGEQGPSGPAGPAGTGTSANMGGVWYVEGADSNGANYVWRVDAIQRGDSVKALTLGMFGPEVNAKVGLFGRVNADGSFQYDGISGSTRYRLEGTANTERSDFTGRRLKWGSTAGPNDTLVVPVTGQKL